EYEILGAHIASGAYFSFDAIVAVIAQAFDRLDPDLAHRLLSWRRAFYLAEGGGEAPPGRIAAQGLFVREERAAFAARWIEDLFAPVLAKSALDALLAERGRFLFDQASGYWWRPSERAVYLDAERFHLPRETVDPLGSTTSYSYDAYDLLVTGVA